MSISLISLYVLVDYQLKGFNRPGLIKRLLAYLKWTSKWTDIYQHICLMRFRTIKLDFESAQKRVRIVKHPFLLLIFSVLFQRFYK